ncbi:hypothetical protein CIPAW_16G035600 [Carya illinoinensis]|uniref:Reverse transcriptase zinc-binding domain-containing protein n=1 Tax=Carya illinoinensis TaxID=32201 RepID=A0A8T1N585_CARIL|nr:hypothetical protein CIPAW_16G035600 [Carya illinoinensis]
MKISKSPKCPICKKEEENVAHILWNCPSAMDVWSHASSSLQKCSIGSVKFSELVKALMSKCDQDTMALFAIIARNIWYRRNQFVFENSFIHPNALVKTARKTLEEFKASQEKPTTQNRRTAEINKIWQSPPSWVTKIN